MMSCPNQGISRSRYCSLKSMISFKDFTGARAERCEIRIQVRLEFVKQHLEFRIVERALRWNVRRIDDCCAVSLDDVEAIVHQLVHRFIEAERFAMHTDARAFQPIRIERS